MNATRSAKETPSPLSYGLAILFIAFAAVMALLLTLEHVAGMALPGCGEGSPCQEVANSFWGKIRLGSFEWPTAYLGLAYFLAILVSWIAIKGRASIWYINLIRFGALISLGFCIIIIVDRSLCLYCIASHVGNFAFWLTAERIKGHRDKSFSFMPSLAITGVLVSVLVGIWDAQQQASVIETAEAERGAATQQIIQNASDATNQEGGSDSAGESGESALFTGRYRVGPEDAPIRIVMYTDYQCQDCYRLEQQAARLYNERDDVSISIKFFPFNSDCNRYITRRAHANSCWAARAAEAAGILYGPDGFWKVHRWLFEKRGAFRNTQDLTDGIASLGLDPTGLVQLMTDDKTLAAVRADTEEAKEYGLHFTPMIFINGVELKGWTAPDALIKTVEQVAATNPPRLTAAADHPPTAAQKFVDDWQESRLIRMPADVRSWSQGSPNPKVKIVVWGDYQEAGTALADSILTAFAASRTDVSYTYRHNPVNSDCNPKLPDRRHIHACRMAQAAEAAGEIAGAEGYWQVHQWLLKTLDNYSDDALREAVEAMGLDSAALFAEMDSGEMDRYILEDIDAGDALPVLRHGMPAGIFSVPSVFVNDRYVVRWRNESETVLWDVLEAAAAE